MSGRKNIADTFSRLLNNSVKARAADMSKSVETDEYVKFVARESTPVALTTRAIERASDRDPELLAFRESLVNGKW